MFKCLANLFKPKSLPSKLLLSPSANLNKFINSNKTESVMPSIPNSPNFKNIESITSLITFFDVMFMPTPTHILNVINKQEFIIFKAYQCLRKDPSLKIALHKKFFQISFPDKKTFDKQEILDFFKQIYPTSNVVLLKNEKVGITATYEVFVANQFGQQEVVHKITMLPENPGNRSLTDQEKSLEFTGQKNCDLQIDFNNGFNTLLDIIIGKNINFKGNLIFCNSHDTQQFHTIIGGNIKEIQLILSTKNMSHSTKVMLTEYLDRINVIFVDQTKTYSCRVVEIQALLVKVIPLIRSDINPLFNPNMIAFISQTENNIDTELLEKLNTRIEDFGPSISNVALEAIMKKALPIYLDQKKVSLEVMNPKDRQWVIDFITKYSPDYLNKL